MSRLIKIVLFIVVLAVAWTYGAPYLRQLGGGGSHQGADAGSGPGADCVRAAGYARDVFGDGMASLGPPGQADLGFRSDLERAIADARSACRCRQSSCTKAEKALQVLANLSDQLGDPAKVAEVAMNSANRLEQVDDLLDGASAAAQRGD